MLIAAVLSACGGGGGGDSSNGADPTSFWEMDTHKYTNGGHSEVSSSSINGAIVTKAVVSTATLAGGDTSDGAYSGSVLTLSFKGTPVGGIYSVVPDQAAFDAAGASTAPMLIAIAIGTSTTTGSSQYYATAGQVRVTKDASGTYHFESVGNHPTTKTMDVLGGVSGAPAMMSLIISNAY
jgi:hypothetical protein